MREYLFRGKRKDNKEWVYGSLIEKDYIVSYIDLAESWEPGTSDHKITCRAYEIIPETIGQYLGIHDKDKKKIFEGDILLGKFSTGLGGKSTKYKDFHFSVGYHHGGSSEFYIDMPKNYGNYRFLPLLSESRVVSTIHDKPELLQAL